MPSDRARRIPEKLAGTASHRGAYAALSWIPRRWHRVCFYPLPQTITKASRQDTQMSARQKLNRAYMNGSLIIAGIAGLATGSWGVFFITSGILVALNMVSGEIRPPR